jgi:hypothetical protein
MEPPVLRFPWVFPLVLLVRLHDPTPDERAVLAETAPDPASSPASRPRSSTSPSVAARW